MFFIFIIHDIVKNLALVSLASCILSFAMISNIGFSIKHNKIFENQKFVFKEFSKGLINILIYIISLSSLTIAITLLPSLLKYSGVDISDDIISGINIVVVIGVFIKSTIYYIKQSINKLTKLCELVK